MIQFVNLKSSLATDLLSPQVARAILVFPLSLNKGSASAFLEIRAKKESGEVVLDRIPVKDLSVEGSLTTRLSDNGRFELIYKKDKIETPWARQELQEGWYAPSEICNLEVSTPSCRYSIERNEETKSVILKIWSQR